MNVVPKLIATKPYKDFSRHAYNYKTNKKGFTHPEIITFFIKKLLISKNTIIFTALFDSNIF